MLTSDSSAPGRSRIAAAWFVYGVWLAMTLAAFVYVARYAHNLPLWDEWEFVPALTHEEPFWPWLWVQHNEHRLPLPRAIYYGLFELTHDFRAGSWVQVIGLSLLALGMISLARRVRGRVSFADAFFPISLLNWGHYENYQMGYQICFMLIAALAGALLAVILTASHGNLVRRGVQAGLLTLLLALCGAAGLAFAPPMALWLLALAAWIVWGARSAERGARGTRDGSSSLRAPGSAPRAK